MAGDQTSRGGGMTGMALEGVRVLDFTQMMMGPWATQFLGDMGAEIVKVERPVVGEWERGLEAMGELVGGQSPFFLAMNRNKKSLTLNLKDPRAIEIVHRLAATSDLVMENYRPGVMDRLGIGYEDLRRSNPAIVYVAGTGFGPDGPYVKRPGQDLLIQAMSGLAAYGGRYDDPPTPSGSSIVDASTAILLAFSAMVGLFHRQRTGEGQRIDVSLFGTAIALQCQELAAFMNIEKRWERSRAGIAGAWLSAPFGIYRTKDGWMAIAMASLAVLGELLKTPALAEFDSPDRAYRDRDQVKQMIEPRLLERTTLEWLELFAARDVWCAPVQTFEDVVDDAQVAHDELITTVRHPDGRDLQVVGVPMRFSRTPGSIRFGPPAVGQHTDEVLRGLGYSEAEVGVLREEGVV
jgi:crotonobetainyl-CoA:carnitine CoA-transferase CaiB-like acyl-CoA transferase